MWRSLVWKEWREQRWRLFFGVALLGMFTIIGLRTRVMPDEGVIGMTIVIGGMFFPLMVAMGLIAPERAEGTLVRLLALPVPAWKVLAAKGVIGAAVCAAPIVISAALAVLIAGDREMRWRELLGMYAVATGVAISMFTWLTAAGVRQPSEARAGLAGIGLMVCWFVLIGISGAIGMEVFGSRQFETWVAACSPMGLGTLSMPFIPPAAIIVVQALSVAAVWAWAAARIGKPGKVVA